MAAKRIRSSWEIKINTEWCKGCEVCVEVCKPQVLEMDGQVAVVARPEDCVGCMLCEMLCPDFAVEVITLENEKAPATEEACSE